MKNTVFYSILIFILLGIIPLNAAKRQMEALDRGLIAVRLPATNFIGWRVLGTEKDASYNVYRNGELIKTVTSTQASNFIDTTGKATDKYVVKAVINGVEEEIGSKEVTPWAQQSQPNLAIKLNRPAGGVTPPSYFDNRSSSSPQKISYPNGQAYTYVPNDCSVGDVDGDGEYEIIVKWDPTNSYDNSFSGMTGNVYIDAYKLDGTQLWRIDLGPNIRAGAHYTQFLVYDFDGDGKAEMVCKTAPGTIDGQNKKVIMGSDDPNKDWRTTTMNSSNGYILNGPEYLTIFNGETGAEINTVAYKPGRGTVSSWGDSYGNRVDRFLACVAYLDGEHPSAVMCRGYYTRTTLAAYDFVNGKLVERWFHDSPTSGSGAYGQGNHNLSVADVDADGSDEIIYGSCVIDHDGSLLYSTKLGHGDAMHVGMMDPDRPGSYQVWEVHEDASAYAKYGYELHDAKTGEIIWGGPTSGDNGRGCAADIDPTPGYEMWSTNKDASGNSIGIFSCKGATISTTRPAVNFRVYWDGDLYDELLDGTKITKWNWSTKKIDTSITFSGVGSCNSTKSTPNLSADIFGDWREEVILWDTKDSTTLHIFTTTTASTYRVYTLMHDPVYRLGIAWQNVAYNQPPHLGYYLNAGVANIPWPDMYTPQDATGINDVYKDNSDLRTYIDQNNMLRIYSDSEVKFVQVYSLEGTLLHSARNLNNKVVEVALPQLQSQIFIVKVTSDSGVKTFKLFK